MCLLVFVHYCLWLFTCVSFSGSLFILAACLVLRLVYKQLSIIIRAQTAQNGNGKRVKPNSTNTIQITKHTISALDALLYNTCKTRLEIDRRKSTNLCLNVFSSYCSKRIFFGIGTTSVDPHHNGYKKVVKTTIVAIVLTPLKATILVREGCN